MTKRVDIQNKALEEILSLLNDGSELILMRQQTAIAHIKSLNLNNHQRICKSHLTMPPLSEDFDDQLSSAFGLGNL